MRVRTRAVLACSLLAAAVVSAAEAPSLTLGEILDKVDDLYRGKSGRGVMVMDIATEHWSRSLTIEFQTQGKDRSLYHITAPKKEAGTATLRVENNIWNYLPKVNRIIKLPSSMMSASWMGSHFTNDDLVKESRFRDDYDLKLLDEDTRDGVPAVDVECTPKPDAPVVWGKVEVVVRRDNYLPLVMRYYDEDMELARTLTFSETKVMDDRTMPTLIVVQPADKPGEHTQIKYEDVDFDVDLPADTFSLRNLSR